MFLFWRPSAYGLIMETAQELLYTVLPVTPPEKNSENKQQLMY